jgi:hypothetical protein
VTLVRVALDGLHQDRFLDRARGAQARARDQPLEILAHDLVRRDAGMALAVGSVVT